MSVPQRFLTAVMRDVKVSGVDKPISVCLGIRIGNDPLKQRAALVRQVRDRYPEIFVGMKPREIEAACRFVVYDVDNPTTHGFPRLAGEAWWWA